MTAKMIATSAYQLSAGGQSGNENPGSWIHEQDLLYRLNDETPAYNRDEIRVTQADSSRTMESRTRRAGELLDLLRKSAAESIATGACQLSAAVENGRPFQTAEPAPTSGAADLPEALVKELYRQIEHARYHCPDEAKREFAERCLRDAIDAVRALAAGQATAAQAVVPAGWKLAPISWSEPSDPNETIRYNHVTADTALGQFSIQWKGWKEHDPKCLYLDGIYIGVAGDLAGAKLAALRHLQQIADALIDAAPAQPAAQQGVAYAALLSYERNASLAAFDHDARLSRSEERIYETAFANGWDRRASHGQAPALTPSQTSISANMAREIRGMLSEAVQILSTVPEPIAGQLHIRHFLCDEMRGAIYCIDDALLAPSPQAAKQAPAGAAFQQRVQPWLLECFCAEIAADRVERNHRFLEESLELVQSLGCHASEAHQLVDYVFGRPVGEPVQEIGGVMVTLAALCLANDLDMHSAGEIELTRISVPEVVAKIRAKQAAKPKHSPLPMAAQADSVQEDAARWRAFVNSARIRLFGWAGAEIDGSKQEKNRYDEANGNYVHFGAEFWTVHDAKTKNQDVAVRLLTTYADAARAAQKEGDV